MIKQLLFLLCFGIILKGSESEKILDSLTLYQKIGQLFIVAAASSFEQPTAESEEALGRHSLGDDCLAKTESLASQMIKSPYRMDQAYIEYLIEKYHIGGICWLFRSTPEKQICLTKYYQSLSTIPLLIAQDCEWGLSMRLDNTIVFPKAGDLGKVRNKQLIYEIGKEIGMQCRAIGVHMNLAPVVDCNSNPNNPVIGIRSFGSDPEHVAQCGIFFSKGLQDGGVLSCAKHFPGHGDTSVDSHLDLPVIRHGRKRLEQVELYPFKKMIEAGVDAVMVGHLCVPELEDEEFPYGSTRDFIPAHHERKNNKFKNKKEESVAPTVRGEQERERRVEPYGGKLLPATFSKNIITNLLRNQFNFNGLIITDGLGMRALTNYYKPGEIELHALLAGNDILLCPVDVPKAVELIEKAIKDGRLTQEEIDKRVLKILSVKEKLGLLPVRKHS